MKNQAYNVVLKGERVAMISLGCARNTVDSEKIMSEVVGSGASICTEDKASIIFVNTCAFTKEAKEESISVISDLVEKKKNGSIKHLIVCGCLSERYAKELKSNFKDVDAFVGIADFKKVVDSGFRLTPKHYAYLKISEGCANLCSYCAIPSIKGPLKSRSEAQVLDEAKLLESSGVRELIVIGQDITLYGREKPSKPKLTALLKKILRATRIPWVRLLYLHPNRIGNELIDLMRSEKRIVPYIDMPLQHINSRILKLMNRGCGKKEILGVIKKIRENLPCAALRTTFIVGFPSETRDEFNELCDFLNETSFDKVGAFKYSREEGTRAYKLRPQVNEKVKQERYRILMSLQKEISARLLERKKGQVMDVMVDEDRIKTDGVYFARTAFDAPEVDGMVFLKSNSRLKCGDIVQAKITDSYEYDLIGEAMV